MLITFPLVVLAVLGCVLSGLGGAWIAHRRSRPWRRALLRIVHDNDDHAYLHHNTAMGALEWAQNIARAALSGTPAPPALEAPQKVNFPAHCERLANELLELADSRKPAEVWKDGGTDFEVREMASVLMDAAAQAALDMTYGGPSRTVPAADVKRIVQRADELRIKLQDID